MSEFRHYIANRRTEIKAKISALRAELRDLEVADQALGANPQTESRAEERGAPRRGRLTIKDMIINILSASPSGADANGLMNKIETTHGVKVQRPSLSPQLSRLKDEGRVILEGSIWKLANTNDEEQTEVDPLS